MAKLKLMLGAVAAIGLLTGGAVMMNHTGDNLAYAQSGNSKAVVDAAIARGEVGEQIDGYLGIVDGANPSSEVRASVQDINIKRKSVYTERAETSGSSPTILAQLTGEKQIKKAAPGTYIKDASGVWKRK